MSLISVLGLGLLFIGGVLFVNGLWIRGNGDDKDVSIFNLLVGGVTFLIVLWWAFGGEASGGTPFNAAGMLLFSMTYLWIGANTYRGITDQRSFGWFCLFVAITAVPTAYLILTDVGDVGLAALWFLWVPLWGAFFVLEGLEKEEIAKPVGALTSFEGIVTGAAGYLMVAGFWPII